MKEYHKINTIFKRFMEGPEKNKIDPTRFAQPEFEYLSKNDWVWTEKIDGTNIRVMFDGERVTFGGKTDNAQIPAPLVTRLQELFPSADCFREVFDGDVSAACLYGEGFGRKIQKAGSSYLPLGVDFILFDVKVGEWWLKREDIEDVAQRLSLAVVPIVLRGTLDDAIHYIGTNPRSNIGDAMMEGLVGKPEVELKSRMGRRIITKIKHKDIAHWYAGGDGSDASS